MAKNKKKSASSKSDLVRSRNSNNSKNAFQNQANLNSAKSLNPFEHQVQKSKFSVLNRREKSNQGTPGFSNKKSFQQRQKTLGVDLNNLNKSNKFYDHRIIAKDGEEGSLENLKRYAILKKKVVKKGRKGNLSKFALNDSSDESGNESDDSLGDILTNKGRPLEDIQTHIFKGQFEQEDSLEMMSSQRAMQEYNFGGGANNNKENRKMTKEEALTNMIKQSKIDRYEKQKEAAELMNITEKADAKFLEIRQTLKVDSDIGTKVLFWNDARNVTDKYERADMYRDQDHDDWLKLVDDLSYDKKALPDKENSVKVERKLEEQRKKEAAKKEMELLFERPEDERPENNESGKYSYFWGWKKK